MKQVDTGEITIRLKGKRVRLPRRTISRHTYDWKFKDDERQLIRSALEGQAPAERIDAFLADLERICGVKKELLGQPKSVDLRDTQKQVLADFKKVLKHLKEIERGKMLMWREKTVADYGAVEPAGCAPPLHLSDIIPTIEGYIKTLEETPSEPKSPGSQPADSDGFCVEVMGSYSEYIGKKPTAYTDGPFFTVMQKTFEALGAPSQDPSRIIRAALKKRKALGKV